MKKLTWDEFINGDHTDEVECELPCGCGVIWNQELKGWSFNGKLGDGCVIENYEEEE
jgi:hypothetical protein